MPDIKGIKLPTRHQIFGDNSRSRFGSDGLGSTEAFGNNYRDYYYTAIRTEVSYREGITYEVGWFLFKQKRTIVTRTTKYFRQVFARDGTLIKEEHIYTLEEQDFKAESKLFGFDQKDAFHDPTGFGAFYTSLVESLGSISVSLSIDVSVDPKTGLQWGKSDFFIHHNDEEAIKAKERVDYELRNRAKHDVATDVRRALSRLSENRYAVESGEFRLISQSLGFKLPEGQDVLITGKDTTYQQLLATVQASSTDVLAYTSSNNKSLIDIYRLVDREQLSINLISVRDRSYSIKVGNSYTAEYLMNFLNSSVVLSPGSYEVVDVDVINIKERDDFGNLYPDPEQIFTTMPLSEIMVLVQPSNLY